MPNTNQNNFELTSELFLNKQKALEVSILGLSFVCKNEDALVTLVEYVCDTHGIEPKTICCLTQKPFALPGSKQYVGVSNSERSIFISGPNIAIDSYKQGYVSLYSSFNSQKVEVETQLSAKDIKDSTTYRLEIFNREVILSFLLGLQRSTDLSKLVLNLLKNQNSIEVFHDYESITMSFNQAKQKISAELETVRGEHEKQVSNLQAEVFLLKERLALNEGRERELVTAAEKQENAESKATAEKMLKKALENLEEFQGLQNQVEVLLTQLVGFELPADANNSSVEYWIQHIELQLGIAALSQSMLPEEESDSADYDAQVSCEKVLFLANFETGIVDQSQIDKLLKQQAYKQNVYNISLSTKDRTSVRSGYKEKTKNSSSYLTIGAASQKEIALFKSVSIAGKNELFVQTLYYVQRKSAQNLFRHLSSKTNLSKIDLIPAGYLYELLDRVQRIPLFESFFQALEMKNAQQFKPSVLNSQLRDSEAQLWVKRNWTSLRNFYTGASSESGFANVTTEKASSRTSFRDQKIAVDYISEILPSLKAALIGSPRFFEIITDLVLTLQQQNPVALDKTKQRVPALNSLFEDIKSKQLTSKVNALKETLTNKSGPEIAEIMDSVLSGNLQDKDGMLSADKLLIHIGALLSILIDSSQQTLPKTARVWRKEYLKGIPLLEKYWQEVQTINSSPNRAPADKWVQIKDLSSGKLFLEALKKQFR